MYQAWLAALGAELGMVLRVGSQDWGVHAGDSELEVLGLLIWRTPS